MIRGEILGRTSFGLIRRSFISGGVLTTYVPSKNCVPIRPRGMQKRGGAGGLGLVLEGPSADTLVMSEMHTIGRLSSSFRQRVASIC